MRPGRPRLAFVVPRYGSDVVGGAELGARMLAEHLVADRGWEVEVLTTCARDARTWADEYPEGETSEAGVRVHRWRSAAGRSPGFEQASARVLPRAAHVTEAQAQDWIDLQGPVCPEVVEAAAASDADVIAFYPYLYYPTVRGLPRVGDRSVLHPAAHDEAPLSLPVFGEVFSSAGGLAFHTYAERELVNRRFLVAHRPQAVVGLGVGPRPQGPAGPLGTTVAGEDLLGIGDRPYLCCLGRVDAGKGALLLARWFAAYKARRPGPLVLALVGPVVSDPPPHPDVVVTGPVDERAKWALLEGALALVSPSPWESFSLVVVEAWTAGIPVVVNGRCRPTREHCEQSGGGLWFDGYGQFEAIVDRLQADPELRRSLAGAGARYVEANYRWPAVLDRYEGLLRRVMAGRGRANERPSVSPDQTTGAPVARRPGSTMPRTVPYRRSDPEDLRSPC